MKMQKAILLTASILLASYEVPTAFAKTSQEESVKQADQNSAITIIYLNSDRIQNNRATQVLSSSTVVKKGVTYVSLRSLASFLGYTFTYDAAAKEINVASNSTEVRYRVHTKMYEINGSLQMMSGEAYEDIGVFMVPITSLTAAFRIPYTLNGDRITLYPGGLSAGSGSGIGTEKPAETTLNPRGGKYLVWLGSISKSSILSRTDPSKVPRFCIGRKARREKSKFGCPLPPVAICRLPCFFCPY
ncbi:copper amine oxidase N-terminal domain-containing protein [Paenibacillus sp.]|jgi:hypothetical protein|uniref:copper amine oxidase N-terminal domain-containing protein n=1 Tax=Paenibacillus sp. TaxID=58172 RepID=UPI0028302B46|nr:copper amine oxidase N-terminal domain-containing protein [Paenibacillus sp.]MDR0267665.1 copper amine oxidase N-terminal domain-containing protein [Paenibacillus sp.]